jgi:hypothetical protein
LDQIGIISRGLLSSQIRSGGLTSYVDSGFMSLFAFSFIILREVNNKNLLKLIFLLLVCLVQARTPLMFMLFLICIYAFKLGKKKMYYLIMFVVLVPIVLNILGKFFPDLMRWASEVMSPSTSGSIEGLSDTIAASWEGYLREPFLQQLLGTGEKNWVLYSGFSTIATDSGYVGQLIGLGFVGSFFLIFYVILLFLSSIKVYLQKDFFHMLVLLLLWLAFFIYNYKGSSFLGLGISTSFYMIFYIFFLLGSIENKSKRRYIKYDPKNIITNVSAL